LFTILGFGVEVLSGFAYVLIFISGLSIFIALYNSLRERRYDIAIIRSMGASRLKVMITLQLEGICLTLMGGVLGILSGHFTLSLIAGFLDGARKAGMTGIVFYEKEWWVLGGAVLLGLLCSALPSIQAYRTDISKTLAGN
jgi:putative ABC transport system permease protein